MSLGQAEGTATNCTFRAAADEGKPSPPAAGPQCNEARAHLAGTGVEPGAGRAGVELRSAIDMATLMAGAGEIDSARALLQPVFAPFVEGLGTADLKAAGRLLATLR